MDWNDLAENAHYEDSLLWSGRFNEARGSAIANWVSTFRNNLACEVVGDYYGSFNWSCRVRFKDGEEWMVRFAVPGRAINGDEKVQKEVATMQFIKAETRIPIASVIAWGISKDNPLKLGAFIIMNFIHGESLGKILEVLPRPESGQILKPDIDDNDLNIIYRQIANILLELSEHDFPQIGSLTRINSTRTCIDSRPLTLKMNEIQCHGGVGVGGKLAFPSSYQSQYAPLTFSNIGHVSRTFSSATEYFHHIAEQDLQHLHEQPNDIDDVDDARRKYLHCSIFKAIIPHFVSPKHDHGPFKLNCDDLRFGNILVNNAKDLKIVAILDWEWTYAAPYQMLCSPPRWLLIKKPIDWVVRDPPLESYFSQYKSYFEKFVKILEEEERKRLKDAPMTSSADEKMSSLMRQSMDDGKFWFHELVYSCFESPGNPAWTAIRDILPNLDDFATVSEIEVNSFIKDKMGQLQQYHIEWAAKKKDIDRKEAEFQALKKKVEEEDAMIEAGLKESIRENT
jgi:hypothetical protein